MTRGAVHAADQLEAELLVLQTGSGVTAMAVSELRPRTPLLALTDNEPTAARLTLSWGVQAGVTEMSRRSPEAAAEFVSQWGLERGLLRPGGRFVLIGTTDWSRKGKDLMLVCDVGETPASAAADEGARGRA